MTFSDMPFGSDQYFMASVPCTQPCTDPCACKLKVEGTGRVSVQPDMASIILGVITENKQVKPAQDENAERMTAILAGLRDLGIPSEDIRTASYNITPQYDYNEGRQIFKGYRVEHLLEITVRDVDSIGQIIDSSVQNGANQVSSISFSLSDPSAYYQLALNAAVDDAVVKAETLSRKLDINVSPVPVSIVEIAYEPGIPMLQRYQTVATATPIQPGTIEIVSRIEAIFAYRPMSFAL